MYTRALAMGGKKGRAEKKKDLEELRNASERNKDFTHPPQKELFFLERNDKLFQSHSLLKILVHYFLLSFS